MESEKLRKYFKVGVVLAIAAVTFYIIAFTSNGWSIVKYGNATIKSGLWYITRCDGHGECQTISKKEQFEVCCNLGSTYILVVRWQVVATITLVCLFVCAFTCIIALYRRIFHRRIRLVIIVCSVLSGCLLLQDLGMSIRAVKISMHQSEREGSTMTVYFPWSLVMVFFAVIFIFGVACACLKLEWEMFRKRTQQLQQNSGQETARFDHSRRSLIWILFIAISIVFRIIAYISNGWRIVVIGESYSTRTHYGLWYVTECNEKQDTQCTTMSIKTIFEDYGYLGLDSYEYSKQVGSQVALTLSLMLSIICLPFLFVEWRRRHSNNLIRINIIVCSLLSGTFWLYDVGYFIRLYAFDMEEGDYITYFPWSILFALLGTIIILIFSFVRIVKELQNNETDYGEFSTQEINHASGFEINLSFNEKI